MDNKQNNVIKNGMFFPVLSKHSGTKKLAKYLIQFKDMESCDDHSKAMLDNCSETSLSYYHFTI